MQSGKTTKRRQAEPKRRYGDACGAAHGLELIGDRWALLIARELMFGPKRFSRLRRDLPGISANVLAERLGELQAAGILVQRLLPPPASAQVYELTAWGRELEPVLITLGRWAARSPAHDPSLPVSPTSVMLSFRTMIVTGRAAGAKLAVVFETGADRFLARVAGGAITVSRDEGGTAADATVHAAPATLAAWIYGGATADQLEAAGKLRIEGDAAAAVRFAGLFSLPPKAAF